MKPSSPQRRMRILIVAAVIFGCTNGLFPPSDALLPALFASLASAAELGRIEISVSGVAPTKGLVGCALFSSKAGFPLESKKHAIAQVRVAPSASRATCIFEKVAPGEYAVAVVHDTNDNNEADTNFIGIPIEGVGVSNNAMPKLSFPKFDDCRFSVVTGQTVKQDIILKY